MIFPNQLVEEQEIKDVAKWSFYIPESIPMVMCRDLWYLYKRELTLKELQKCIMILSKNKKALIFPMSMQSNGHVRRTKTLTVKIIEKTLHF